MSVIVTLNFDTPAAAAAALLLLGQAPAPAVPPHKVPAPPKPAEPAAAAKPAATPAGDAPVPYEKSGIPERIQKLVAKDRSAAVALLGEFGVKKGVELKPEQFADFAARCDAALADSLT